MPKRATRRFYFAALAVPVTMVIAPLTASAGEPEEAVQGHQQAHAIDTDWYEPESASATYDDSDDANVTYVINGIHEDSVTGNYEEESGDDDEFSPGPDWYYDANATYDDSDEANVTYVVNGIHEDSVTGNYEDESDDDEFAYADEDEYVVAQDYGHDLDAAHAEDEWGGDANSAGAAYDSVDTGAGSGGAWFNSVEAEAFTQQDGDFGQSYGDDDGDDDDDFSAGEFDEMTSAAGQGGAFTESTESEFVEQG